MGIEWEQLTAIQVQSLSALGLHGDGGTLYLRVAPGGSKSWIQRVTVNGRRRDIGLGGWPVASLAKARERAFANRVAIANGQDPLAEKHRTRVPTFREAAERTFEANRARWRNNKTTANWMQGMEKRVFPVLGDQRVDQVGREDVLRVLTPIWTAKPEVARKLRQRIRATLRWCQGPWLHRAQRRWRGLLTAPYRPCRRCGTTFGRCPIVRSGRRSKSLGGSRASLAAKACLRFVVLTACRSGEARNARWVEIDGEAREWRIPASRMKGGAEHRVPLSDAVVTLLEMVRPLRDRSDLVFPSPTKLGKPLSDMTLTKVLRDTGLAGRTVVHGFRTSFRTWASERTSVPHAVAEMALAHTVGSAVERSYARSDLFEKRRGLMDQWAAYVTGASATVVRLHG